MTLPHTLAIRLEPVAEALPPRETPPHDWLQTAELAELGRIHDGRRRRQWLAGRWLSKQLIAEAATLADVCRLQILARDERGRGVRPSVELDGQTLDWSLSISHSERGVLVAMAPSNAFSVGVDLTDNVPSTDAFRRLWFSARERQWIEENPALHMGIAWAIKEAVYKAVNSGQTWDPRDVEVLRQRDGNFACSYRGQRLQDLAMAVHDWYEHVAVVACLSRAGLACQSAPIRCDAAIMPRVQRGLNTPARPLGGLISTREKRVFHFQRYIQANHG